MTQIKIQTENERRQLGETLEVKAIPAEELSYVRQSQIVIAPDGTVCLADTTMRDFDRRYTQR